MDTRLNRPENYGIGTLRKEIDSLSYQVEAYRERTTYRGDPFKGFPILGDVMVFSSLIGSCAGFCTVAHTTEPVLGEPGPGLAGCVAGGVFGYVLGIFFLAYTEHNRSVRKQREELGNLERKLKERKKELKRLTKI